MGAVVVEEEVVMEVLGMERVMVQVQVWVWVWEVVEVEEAVVVVVVVGMELVVLVMVKDSELGLELVQKVVEGPVVEVVVV